MIPPALRWVLLGLGGLVVLLVGGVVVGLAALHEPLPEGRTDCGADEALRSMIAAVDGAAWERTGAVQWSFSGRNDHLWDRQRHLARVVSGDRTVLVDLTTRNGRAWDGGQELQGSARDAALDAAWAAWANDSFWLNPIVKAFDEGTTRRCVQLADGRDAYLVRYASGGVTPGDAYAWVPGGEAGRPAGWTMWVGILPIGGVETGFTDWVQLDTGAWVATEHPLAWFDGVSVSLSDVRGAATLVELTGGDDPFAPLFE